MGIFNVKLEIGNPQGERYEVVEAMVDSGSAYTTLPASLPQRLGVSPHDTHIFELADGSRIQRDFGRTWMRLEGKEDISPFVFWDDDVPPLLGAVTLEIFSLGIDPVNSRLIPVNSRA